MVDSVLESAVAVAVAAFGNMKLVVDPVVFVPVRLPVQLAPVAQQAMLLAASLEQFVPCLQHAFALPSSVQGFVPLGQLLSARCRMRRTSKARRLTASSAGEKGAVIEFAEVRNVAAIQIQEDRILVEVCRVCCISMFSSRGGMSTNYSKRQD